MNFLRFINITYLSNGFYNNQAKKSKKKCTVIQTSVPVDIKGLGIH